MPGETKPLLKAPKGEVIVKVSVSAEKSCPGSLIVMGARIVTCTIQVKVGRDRDSGVRQT